MRKLPFLFCSLLLLTGCWDQRQLKDSRLVNGISFDTTEDPDKILGTVRAINIRSSGGGKFEVMDEFYEAEEETVSELEIDLQNKVSGQMDVEKAFIIIVGEDLAKSKGIAPLLEPFFRSVKGYIASSIVISEGKGNEILTLNKQDSPIVFEVNDLLIGGVEEAYIPDETTFTVWNHHTAKEKDMILPYIKKDTEDKLKLAGSALFNDDKFTGHTLTTSQTSLLIIMMNQLKKRGKLIIQSNEFSQPLTLAIHKATSKMDVKKEKGKVTCTINTDLKARVLSYYEETTPKNIKSLNKIASKELTKKARELTDLLIEANSDALGVGEELSVTYHDSWNPDTWKENYQEVKINPKVNVDIIGTNNLK